MNRIRLFIGGTEVEQGDELTVALTYQLTDLYTPTAVRTPYSKTITIDGTPHNNEIFSNYWELTHSVSVSGRSRGVEFNPSKRVSSQIYVDGIRLIDGYVRLDSVQRQNGGVKYQVTFYSELGNFFYILKNNEDTGAEMTLADVLPEFEFTINKDTVKQAWDNGSICDGLISFAPCYNGYASGFDSDRAIVNLHGNKGIGKDTAMSGGTVYSSYRGMSLAEFKRNYDEYEMRDLRSYNQRPVINVRKVIESICDSTDYDVHLDERWFNDSNPYYSDVWMTLGLLHSLDGIQDDNHYDSEFGETFVKYTQDYINSWADFGTIFTSIPPLSGDISNDSDGIIDFSEMQRGAVSMTVRAIPAWIPDSSDREKVRTAPMISFDANPAMVCMWMTVHEIPRGGGEPVLLAQSKIHGYTTSAQADSSHLAWMRRNATAEEGYMAHTNCVMKYDEKSENIILDRNFIPYTLTFPRKDNIRIEMNVALLGWAWNVPTDSAWLRLNPQRTVSIGTKPAVYVKGGGISMVGEDTPLTGSVIKSRRLLASSPTPFDFLLSYAKMFGLLFVPITGSRRIDIMMRDTFYNGGKKDISSMIDYERDFSITPLLYDTNWYRFRNDIDDTHCTERYALDFGEKACYGEHKVSTNYGFPSDIRDMYSGVLKGGVESLESSPCYRTFYRTDGTQCPAPVAEQPVTYRLYEDGDVSGSSVEVTETLKTGAYDDWNLMSGFDIFPKMCLRTSDGGEVDGSRILLFKRGDVDVSRISMWITDDFDDMFLLNNDKPCYLITESETLADGKSVAVKADTMPSFGRITDDGNYSLDFGVPRETFIANLQIGSYATVYSRFWETYIRDLYDVNTKKVTCYVKFDEPLTQECMRRFYFFEGAYWILNKVSDYNPVKDVPVKCEFVKVMRLSDYTQGQRL